MSDSEKEDAGRSSPIPSRHEKSLGLLTAKFVEMLKNAEGGLLDLKKVASYQRQEWKSAKAWLTGKEKAGHCCPIEEGNCIFV